MLSRREVIGKAAVGAAAAAVTLGAARVGAAATRAFGSAMGASNDRDGHDPLEGHIASAPDAATHKALDASAPPAESAAIASPPPWELVRPLAAGAPLAYGWQLGDLGAVRDGSCVATLQNARGRSHRVHLCRNDGRPQGLVYTRRVDLVVMNEGHGELPTEENLAQAVAELAHAIAANEAKAPKGLFADLLPHTERVRRFASADGPAAYGKLR